MTPTSYRRSLPILGVAGVLIAAAAAAWYLMTSGDPARPGAMLPLLIIASLVSVATAVMTYVVMTNRRNKADRERSDDIQAILPENLPGMSYRCLNDEKRKVEFVSAGCEKICGYRKSDFEARRVFWGDLIHDADRQRVRDVIAAAIEASGPFELEYRIVDRDGAVRWMWERGRAAARRGDQDLHLEGFVTEVTSRKQAEDALQRAESFAKAIVDNAVEAIIAIDSRGRIDSFNVAAQQMFGYSIDEATGRNVSMLMPEPFTSEHDGYVRAYVDTGNAKIIGLGREVSGKHRDGSVFPIQLSVSEVFHQSERKFVGLIRDISRQRETERELREQRERLAHLERLNTLGEMATGIAHEINQPLTAISMYAQSGIRFLGQPDPRRDRLLDALEKLSAQAHRAGSIIERMQQMARRHRTRHEIVDLNQQIIEICRLAEAEAHLREVVISRQLAEQELRVDCDPIQIQQVALNFLRNAMEAMQVAGRPAGTEVLLITEDRGEMVRASVVDTGPGVSTEIADDLFQPFSSTKESGMGMGLSISKSIITSHGGQIGFANNPGGGATFYFTLPKATREK